MRAHHNAARLIPIPNPHSSYKNHISNIKTGRDAIRVFDSFISIVAFILFIVYSMRDQGGRDAAYYAGQR